MVCTCHSRTMMGYSTVLLMSRTVGVTHEAAKRAVSAGSWIQGVHQRQRSSWATDAIDAAHHCVDGLQRPALLQHSDIYRLSSKVRNVAAVSVSSIC